MKSEKKKCFLEFFTSGNWHQVRRNFFLFKSIHYAYAPIDKRGPKSVHSQKLLFCFWIHWKLCCRKKNVCQSGNKLNVIQTLAHASPRNWATLDLWSMAPSENPAAGRIGQGWNDHLVPIDDFTYNVLHPQTNIIFFWHQQWTWLAPPPPHTSSMQHYPQDNIIFCLQSSLFMLKNAIPPHPRGYVSP